MEDFIQVGKYTYGVNLDNVYWNVPAWTKDFNLVQPKLLVGNYCSIGKNAMFYLGGNHRYDWVTTFPFHVYDLHQGVFNSLNQTIDGYPCTNGDIIVGNDVWFGENVTVLSGVTIGDGAVIGTNSTITKDVKPYSIVGGNPAKHIKYRFNEEHREKLVELKWWDLEESVLNKLLPFMMTNQIDLFIDECLKCQ